MATKQAQPGNREQRQALGELKKGYKLRQGNDGHFKIVAPDGKLVRDDNGKPVTVAGTASDWRSARNNRALFKRLGIVETNGSTPKRAKREHVQQAELRGPDRATQAADAKERQRKTDILRKEMEPWIKQLGGWESRGLASDLAAIIVKTTPGAFASNNSAQVTVSSFKNGGALSDSARAAFYAVHDLFKDEDDVRGVYVDLIRHARGLESSLGPVRLKPGEEWPYKVELIKLEDLFNDYAYQRPIHETFVRDLVIKFDERLVGVIDVAAREDGSYAILDGQQRTETMRRVGKTTCYCAIYEGMTVQEEAQYFFHKNKDRKGMSAFYGFRAKVLAGDEDAVTIDKMVKKAGFVLGPVTDHEKQIGAVRAVIDVYEWDSTVRDNPLPATLDLIRKCWLGRKGAFDAEIIRGTGRFFRVFADDEIAWDHFIEVLTEFGPALIIGRARDFSKATEQRGHGKSMAMTLLEIHNTGLKMADRLNLKRFDQDDATRRAARRAA